MHTIPSEVCVYSSHTVSITALLKNIKPVDCFMYINNVNIHCNVPVKDFKIQGFLLQT